MKISPTPKDTHRKQKKKNWIIYLQITILRITSRRLGLLISVALFFAFVAPFLHLCLSPNKIVCSFEMFFFLFNRIFAWIGLLAIRRILRPKCLRGQSRVSTRWKAFWPFRFQMPCTVDLLHFGFFLSTPNEK